MIYRILFVLKERKLGLEDNQSHVPNLWAFEQFERVWKRGIDVREGLSDEFKIFAKPFGPY